MAEQNLGINVWLRDNVVPGLERLQRSLNETARKANESFSKVTTRRFQGEIDEARRKVKQLEADLAVLSRFKSTPKIELDTKEKELRALQARLALLSSKRYTIRVRVEENWSTFERHFKRGAMMVNKQLVDLQNNTSLFGKFLLLAGLAITPLVTAIMALSGALMALVGSLSLAIAALGGAFVAAIAQAVPAVLLLVAAFSRLGSVFKAVQAEEKKATAGADDHTAALDRQRNAARNLIRAREQLGDAEKNLSEARRQARRDLEDLAAAERRVRIEQENARLAAVGARRSARSALGSGSFLEFEQAQLEVDSAQLGREDAALQGSRTLEDAARTRAEGVSGNQQVIQAQRALRDATWALADAHREVARAQKEQGTAAAAAAEANKNLSKSERELRDALIELRKVWKTLGPQLTDPIIESFTFMVRQITKLIQDPGIQSAVKELSQGIARSLRILFAEMTSPRNLSNLRTIFRQAAQNLPILARATASLLTALNSLAIAADPIFKRILGGLDGWAKGLKEATADQDGLNKKLEGLQPHLDAWLRLLGSIWGLFKELVIVSSEAGRVLTEDIADKFDEWTQWLRDNREAAKGFFEDASETARILASALAELIVVLGESTSFEWLQQLAIFFRDVLVPALGNAIKIIWTFSGVLTALLSLPIIRDLVQWAATFAIVAKAVSALAIVFKFLAPAAKAIGILKVALVALWATGFGPYIIVIGGIIAILVILEKRFGIVSKAIDWLKDAAKRVIDWLRANWKEALLVLLTGPFGLIVVALRRWGDDILDFFKGLPSKIFNAARDIGSSIVDGIADGLTWAIDKLPFGIGGTIKRFLGMEDGPSEADIQSTFGANAGYVFGQALPAPDMATGGMVPATPGGRRVRLGEGGYDEYVISTDPRYRRRSGRLLGEAAGRLSPYPHGGPGMDPGLRSDNPPHRGSRIYGQTATNVIRADLTGVNKNLVSWVVDLIQKVNAGNRLWIGTGKVGHRTYVKGTTRRSAHSYGMAVDVNSDLLPKYGDTTPNEDYPLDRFARLARAGLGLPDGISGNASNSRGQVIWRIDLGNQGGNHFHHVHVGWSGGSSGSMPSVPEGMTVSGAPSYSPGSSASSRAERPQTVERPETREEFHRRVTGYSRGSSRTAALKPWLDAAYASKRIRVKQSTGAAVKSAGKQAADTGRSVAESAGGTPSKNMALGRSMAASKYGWRGQEWEALKVLWTNESGWRHNADNPTSDAYGIPQAMSNLYPETATAEWKNSPAAQIGWGLDYIKRRYGSPSRALAHWRARVPINGRNVGHWYESGGEVRGREGEPRTIVAHAGEMVINRGQQAMLGGAKFLRKLFGQRPDTGHFQRGGEITSRLNITPDEATDDLRKLNRLVGRIRVGRQVKTAENLVTTLNILFEEIEERLTVLQANVEKARAKNQVRAKTRSFAFSGGRAVQLLDEVGQAEARVGDIGQERGLVQQQITQTNRSLTVAQGNLRRAQAFARRNPRSPVAERRLQQAEKAVNLFSGQIQDLVGTRADLAAEEVGLQRDIANAGLARGADAVTGIDERISRASSRGQSTVGLLNEREFALNVQALGIDKARNEALARGDTDYAEELRKQLDSLDSAIVQAQQDKINAAISDVQEQRSKSDRRLDLGERIAKFFGRDIGKLIDQRIGSIRDQIGGLTAQIAAAEASGNTKLADELRDQIAELNQEINEQYRRKFQEAREAADKQFSFQSGINDVALQIAQLSGPGFTQNLPAIVQALNNRATLLRDRGFDLQRQLNDANLTGDQDTIRELTLAIEENKLAILQNSQALAEATGALQDQTWSSSAWEQFRVAIFDGLGGLMPNMQVPALATGGYIKREGLFKLHAGEAVIPADQVASGAPVVVNIATPMEMADPITVGERIGYEVRTRARR